MKVIIYIFLTSTLAYAESSQPKRIAVETILEFDKKPDGLGLDFIDDVQKLLDKVKNAIRSKTRRKSTTERLKFTDFLENAVIILKTYRDEDLQKVFDILDEELQKYHYQGCKIHELTEKYPIRRFISDKLDEVKKTSPKKIRRDLDIILKMLQERKYDGKHGELIRFLNSIYGTESTVKLATVLNNLQQYQANTRKSYLDLLSILRNGLRSAIFDHYSNLSNDVRKELKLKLESYWTDNMNNKINHHVIQFGDRTLKTFDSFEFTTPEESPVRFIPNLSETEDQVTKKERKRKRKERHRANKNEMTTESESFQIVKNFDINSGRIMTLYPEPIKKKHKTGTTTSKTHFDDSRDSPHPLYRSVVKRHGKKHKKRRESKVERSIKKLKRSKEILRSHYTVERQGDWDTVNENTERVKSTTLKHKTKNREAKTHKHEKRKIEKAVHVEEKSSRSNEDKPRVRHFEKNVLRSKKRVTKKSTSDEKRKVTAHIRYNDRDDFADTSSLEDYPKSMRFRNMDAESNEGMSIEGFAKPEIFYRKSNSNDTFVNSVEKKKEIQVKIPDKGLIKRLDYLENQLQAVKIKIANQRDIVPNFVTEKIKYTIDSNSSESTETTTLESNNSSETNTNNTNIPLSTKSKKTIVKTSTSSVTTTKPVVNVTASSTTVKLTKVTTTTTATATKENKINETRKEKPRVIIKKTNDYYVIPNSENILNTTMPSYQKFDVSKNVSNKEFKKNLRKTGLPLDDGVDNIDNNKNKTIAPPPLSKLELQKALFNDSMMEHEGKEKDLLIKKTVDEDLNKIFGEMPDGKMDLQMPNFDTYNDNNNTKLNYRRNMGSVVGKGGYSMPSFDMNNFKDPFSGDLDI